MSEQIIPTAFGDAEVRVALYGNGRDAVMLMAVGTGEKLYTLSVNLPDETLGEDEFFAKVWSENEPVVAPALESGLFEDTGRRVSTGHVEAHVWKFIPAFTTHRPSKTEEI